PWPRPSRRRRSPAASRAGAPAPRPRRSRRWMHSAEHRTALLDWLGCAAGGREHRAARAARMLGDGLFERIAAAGTAGHVLDYDDTYLPGLAHLSAPTAPAALVAGAAVGATVGDVLDAFAA